MRKAYSSRERNKDRFADSRGMRHYVCYHNEERMGYSYEEADEFVVGTSKKVDKIIGNKVWIIAGIGRPRDYYLCSWFIADGTDENDDEYFKYIVYGSERTSRGSVDPPIKLNDLPWFREFLKTQANFSFGLRVMLPKFAIKFEELVSRASKKKKNEMEAPVIGGGSVAPMDKRLVEKRAIDLVSKKYKDNGWVVKSVENEKQGFDLLCRKGRLEEHVEVKGLKDSKIEFTLTANEYRYASRERRFRICIVTSALTSPKIHSHKLEDLISGFEIEPIAYRCKAKK